MPFSSWPRINVNDDVDDVSSVQPITDGNKERSKVVRRPIPSTIATAIDAPSGMAHLWAFSVIENMKIIYDEMEEKIGF